MERCAVAWVRAPRLYPLAHVVSTELGSATLTGLPRKHARDRAPRRTEPLAERTASGWIGTYGIHTNALPHRLRRHVRALEGVLPSDCEIVTVFGGAVATTSTDVATACSILDYLGSGAVATIKTDTAFRRRQAVSEDGRAELRRRRDRYLRHHRNESPARASAARHGPDATTPNRRPDALMDVFVAPAAPRTAPRSVQAESRPPRPTLHRPGQKHPSISWIPCSVWRFTSTDPVESQIAFTNSA